MKHYPDALVGAFERIDLDPSDYPLYHGLIDQLAEMDEIDKIDHLTFITPWQHTERFLSYWQSKGFEFHGEWNTRRYPARHLALIRGGREGHPWEDMVGLSVSDQPRSPIDRSLANVSMDDRAVPHTLQHVALHVNRDADMQAVHQKLSVSNVSWMTDVLTYHDPNGAELNQMFTQPNGQGFFVEFAQRKPSAEGKPYAGFDPDIIDDLYQALDQALPGGTD